jgi:hypothetical protein
VFVFWVLLGQALDSLWLSMSGSHSFHPPENQWIVVRLYIYILKNERLRAKKTKGQNYNPQRWGKASTSWNPSQAQARSTWAQLDIFLYIFFGFSP